MEIPNYLELDFDDLQDEPYERYEVSAVKCCIHVLKNTKCPHVQRGECSFSHHPKYFFFNDDSMTLKAWTEKKSFVCWILKHARKEASHFSRAEKFFMAIINQIMTSSDKQPALHQYRGFVAAKILCIHIQTSEKRLSAIKRVCNKAMILYKTLVNKLNSKVRLEHSKYNFEGLYFHFHGRSLIRNFANADEIVFTRS